MNLLRTKAIEANLHADTGLRRVLTATDLTLLGIGCIIGTGIFVLTGVAAAEHAGPAIVLSFVIAGLACAFTALCYSELSSAIGGSGSAYGYAYAGIGEIVAWVIGWCLILEYGVATATVAIGWSGYLQKILQPTGFWLPATWTEAPMDGGTMNLSASLIVLAITGLLAIGVKESARFNAAVVFIKLIAIATFIVVAGPHVDVAHWHPFIPSETVDANGVHHFGWPGVVTGAATIFFAYIGFDAVSTAGEECKNPQRDLPIGILASLMVCTVLYIVVSGILTGVVPYALIDLKAPIADAMSKLGIRWAEAVISAGAIAGLTTVMLVLFYGLTRVFFAMSRDGLLPKVFATVHPKTGTPVRVIFGSGVLISLIAGFSPINKVAELVNMGTLAAFVMVCLSVIILRRTRPDLDRRFKTPFVPVIPILGMLFCAYLMYSLPAVTWHAFFIWMGLGLGVYFAYSRTHSTLAQTSFR